MSEGRKPPITPSGPIPFGLWMCGKCGSSQPVGLICGCPSGEPPKQDVRAPLTAQDKAE